ncbi:MAG: M36 family metallopeptidase [Bacteroidetes bacterium]|nr:M36 family metallopeptidase [Bacteroidota bacterium]
MNLMYVIRRCLTLSLMAFWAVQLLAQTSTAPHETALRYLKEHAADMGLSVQDVADLKVTDEYRSKNNGVTHVWIQQQHAGIPVYNALIGLHVLPNGNVKYVSHRLVANLAQKINLTAPSLSAYKALELAMANLGFGGFTTPNLKEKTNERNWLFEGGAISSMDIPVNACYEPQRDGSVRLAWMLVIAQANTSDVWSMRVDAQTGLILSKHNRTVYCQAGHAHSGSDEAADCEDQVDAPATASSTLNENDETYNVFPLPAESPSHGSRELLLNPADPAASPFGWLDVDGVPGPEYTYTRGNNAWAYEDSANDNNGSPIESAQGSNGVFNFPFDPNLEPESNRSAAITNLFYMTNKMHDISYRFGFDEDAGNYQANNFGRGGNEGDPVMAEALDGSGVDNANFVPTPDGFSGRMQMYKWNRQGGKLLTVNAPAAISGTYSVGTSSGWGATIGSVPFTGDVVLADDGSGAETSAQGCGDYTVSLAGKIVMVDRGDCTFVQKAQKAQQAGAVACIVCNFEEDVIPMGGSGVNNFPIIMLKKSDCDLLKPFTGISLNASIVVPPVSGPERLDGDFDNGIIAHEYTHGISNRLTGGPSTADCLTNEEQMGEGWSDFFTLATTIRPGDVAGQKRGIGTYVQRQGNDGRGIRRYAYSTDMSINPQTYSWVALTPAVTGDPTQQFPHQKGEIWTSMLWDLYWAMVEKYGYDADINNANSGNARALQLVIDGMKIQPCDPGFVDGRDAIVLADLLNYEGVDTCLIMDVFARRGLGVGASQGSAMEDTDGVENFDPIPYCIKELKIKKETTTPLIEPGEEVSFKITVINHREEATVNTIVTDELPDGLFFLSASNGGTFSNGVITWNLGSVPAGQSRELTYTAKSAEGVGSQRQFRDPMDTDENWISLALDGNQYFSLQSAESLVGPSAWKANSLAEVSDFTLETPFQSFVVSGNQPVLRFWHRYNTEKSADAGILEIKKIDDVNWRRFTPEKVFRNSYPASVQYSTFGIPYLSAFSGNSNGWLQSYFDISDYAGEEVTIRFRFATDDNTANPGDAWLVDEVEVLDMLNYNSQACVTADGSNSACAVAKERGVIVQPAIVGTQDVIAANALGLVAQPNPADDLLHLSTSQALSGDVRATLVAADGRVVLTRSVNGLSEGQLLTLDVQQVPAGVYMVRLENAAGVGARKVVIR